MTHEWKRNRDEEDRWLAKGEEVTALFDCAVRGLAERNRTVAEKSVLALMGHLDPEGRETGARVLAHFDSCLATLERGDFDEALEVLLELKESWVEALATLRRDRSRAAHLN